MGFYFFRIFMFMLFSDFVNVNHVYQSMILQGEGYLIKGRDEVVP